MKDIWYFISKGWVLTTEWSEATQAFRARLKKKIRGKVCTIDQFVDQNSLKFRPHIMEEVYARMARMASKALEEEKNEDSPSGTRLLGGVPRRRSAKS